MQRWTQFVTDFIRRLRGARVKAGAAAEVDVFTLNNNATNKVGSLDTVSDDACYRAMCWLIAVEERLVCGVFDAVADLLNLEVDLLFSIIRIIGPQTSPLLGRRGFSCRVRSV